MDEPIVRRLPVMSREELLRRLADPRLTVVDTLPRPSYEAAHIRGAVSLPLSDLEALASRVLPDREAEIVVYCTSST